MEDDNEMMNPKKRGLGRGLNALFEDEEGIYPQIDAEGQASGRKRDSAGVEFLAPGMAQPRHDFDEKSLQDLAASIKTHGLLQPILVRKDKDREGYYEIIAGERRWRAAQIAQLHEVPIVVLDLSDIEALEIALIENLQRENLNPIEEAQGYQKLMHDYGHTQEKLASALGKSRSHIANTVRLLSLPDSVQTYLEEGALSPGHARALITSDKPEELAKEVVSRGLNVRQTEALASDLAGKKPSKTVQKTKMPKDSDTLALEKELSDHLGMSVSIDTSDGVQGHVRIHFRSLDQLDDILGLLSSPSSGNAMGSARRLMGQ
ncbi:MAG: ParB/RepB/Spo0J family partition protein [Alphaproteobacteria bacterium]